MSNPADNKGAKSKERFVEQPTGAEPLISMLGCNLIKASLHF